MEVKSLVFCCQRWMFGRIEDSFEFEEIVVRDSCFLLSIVPRFADKKRSFEIKEIVVPRFEVLS